MDSRRHDRPAESVTGKRSLLGLDIETTGLDPRRDEIVAIAIHDGSGGNLLDVRGQSKAVPYTLVKGSYENHVIIGHNLAFDMAFLKQKYGVGYPHMAWDTMLAERLLTAGILEEEVNLKYLALKYLNMNIDKTQTTTFNMEDVLTPEQTQYVLDDVKATYEIAKLQKELLEKHKLGKVWELERRCLPIFTEMVRRGVMVDRDVLDPLLAEARQRHNILGTELQEIMTPLVEWRKIEKRDEMQGELDEYMDRLNAQTEKIEATWTELFENCEYAATMWSQKKWDDEKINKKDGKPEGQRRFVKHYLKEWRAENPRPPAPKLDTGLINLNSPFQPKDAFLALGIPLPNMQGATLLRAVADAPEEGKRVLTMFAEWKKLEKLLSSFGEKIIELMDDEGALHGDFKQIGTDTGRPTCSKPNMLQMPSKKTDPRFRSIFVPRKGHLFVVADYSQIELRIMAELSGDPAMTKAFKEGFDLHTYTASLMFNVEMGEVTDRQRSTAKTINFGILYGMGPKKLRETLAGEGIEMTMAEANEAVTQWKKSYRLAAAKIQEWQNTVLKLGFTETPFGRKRFFDLDTDDKYERFGIQRAGANHVIQGTSADITKLGMVLVTEMLQGYGTIVLQVYDEIVVEVPEEYADWAKEVVQIGMVEAAKEVLKTVPVAVDAVVSRSWNEDDAIS